MNNTMKQIRTFEKNVNILFKAIASKQIDPKHFTASEAGLSGSACRSLKDKWGVIRAVDHVTSFIPIDEDENIYRKIEITIYETCRSADTVKTIIKNAYEQEVSKYNLRITSLMDEINMLQREKEAFIKEHLS